MVVFSLEMNFFSEVELSILCLLAPILCLFGPIGFRLAEDSNVTVGLIAFISGKMEHKQTDPV